MVQVQDSVIGLTPVPLGRASWRPGASRRSQHGIPAGHENAHAVHALCARFPVIRRMVGEPSFGAVVRRFIAGEPPRTPVARSYGESFPRFIRAQGNSGSIEYVADIAELEMAVGKARYAAQVRPLGTKALSALQAGRVAGLRIALHPSVCLVQSRFPIVTIWNSSRGDEPGTIRRWRPEAALVARPLRRVEVRRLPPGGHAFLRALSEGQPVGMAADTAAAAAPGFALARNLVLLQKANVVVGLQRAA
jgi:hypothetical protein